MAFTKITHAGIGSTGTVLLENLQVIGVGTFGTLSVGGTVSVGGTLTYEDVTNIDSVGLITARNGIKVDSGTVTVGSGVTISPDNIFTTGIVTASSFSGDGTGLTGVAGTENIRTNTNATFLQNINVSGTTTATNFIGGGANLTALNATQLTSGTIPDARYPSTLPAVSGANLTGINVGVATTAATGITGITTVLDLSNNDHKITVSGITTVDVRGGTEGDSHSLRIINSGITTVGFSTYFLFPSGSSPIIPTADGTLSMISFTVHRQGAVGLATQLFAGASVNFS